MFLLQRLCTVLILMYSRQTIIVATLLKKEGNVHGFIYCLVPAAMWTDHQTQIHRGSATDNHTSIYTQSSSVRQTASVSVLFTISPSLFCSLCLTISWQTTEFMWGETRPFHILTTLLNTWRHAPLPLSLIHIHTDTKTKNSCRTGRLTAAHDWWTDML